MAFCTENVMKQIRKSLFSHNHCSLCLHSFIHKMNTVEFKSATFPNAGSRHLLDDSVMESHSPSRGQAESSTLSSGISLGTTRTNILNTVTQSLCHHISLTTCFHIQGAARALSSAKRCLGQHSRGKAHVSTSNLFFHPIHMKNH